MQQMYAGLVDVKRRKDGALPAWRNLPSSNDLSIIFKPAL